MPHKVIYTNNIIPYKFAGPTLNGSVTYAYQTMGGVYNTDPKTTVEFQDKVYAIRANALPYTTTANNTFDISDKNVNSENIPVTINDFVILDPTVGDYTVSNGILTINYIIGVGDVIEVENIDTAPMFGKAFLRSLFLD